MIVMGVRPHTNAHTRCGTRAHNAQDFHDLHEYESLKNYVTADCGAAIALTSTEESHDGATEHQEGEKSEQ